MLAKRSMSAVPLKEPVYHPSSIPRCTKLLDHSVVLKPTRKELQESMAEIVHLCNEAARRQCERKAKGTESIKDTTQTQSATAMDDTNTLDVQAEPSPDKENTEPALVEVVHASTSETQPLPLDDQPPPPPSDSVEPPVEPLNEPPLPPSEPPSSPRPTHPATTTTTSTTTTTAAAATTTTITTAAGVDPTNAECPDAVYSSKPLSIEFIADRLDIDDPIQGMEVRSQEGHLQGIITWTTFTTWQRFFRWDSRNSTAELDEWDGDDADKRVRDTDGKLADELQSMIYEGDPDEGGVVWPRVAEIGLLGALGCGRWLAQAVIQELEKPSSPYLYVVLQATTNSIPFYESLGFVRVGALARYDMKQTDDSKPLEEYNFNKSHISSPTYWYTHTKEDETPRQIATKTGVDVDEILFLNRLLYGEDGLTGSSRLRRGTPLRLPLRNQTKTANNNTLQSSTYTTVKNNETTKGVAAKLNITVKDLVDLNKVRHKGLTATSVLMKGTQLLLPGAEGSDAVDDMSTLTDEVAYRHWTFNDDSIDFTEASYMMVYRLKPVKQRKKNVEGTLLETCGTKLGLGRPPTLRIPLGCKTPAAFRENSKATRTTTTTTNRPKGMRKPVKPKGAGACFSAVETPRLQAEHPEMAAQEINKKVKDTWRELPTSQRKPYKQQADALKIEYETQLVEFDSFIPTTPHSPIRRLVSTKIPKVFGAPSNLFNKVVTARGYPGVWFVLTYIPDLQWCHLGPMIQRGTYGSKRGVDVDYTGHPRWVLAPEGTMAELDVSAFNCTVVKSKTVRKTPDADKEEWFLMENIPSIDYDNDVGLTTASNATSWFTAALITPECRGANGKFTAANNNPQVMFSKGDLVQANWRGRGTLHPGQVTAVQPSQNGVRNYSIRYDDGDFEVNVPAQRVSALKRAKQFETYALGEMVLGNWKGLGKMFKGKITGINEEDEATGAVRTYAVTYEDNDVEDLVHPNRLKKIVVTTSGRGERKRRRITRD